MATKINKVGILYHPLIEKAGRLAGRLSDFLTSQKVAVWSGSAWEVEKARVQLHGTGLVMSVGGDGTILRTAHVVTGSKTPILGINLGTLGFMTELSEDEAFKKLPGIIGGEGWLDERSMLQVSAPISKEEKTYHALNDIVLARGAVARVVHIEVNIEEEKFTSYTADGVIAATATGSTGYSLAAGGPILYPNAKDFLLLPMLPHLSLPYTLVLPEKAIVKLRIDTSYSGTLAIDGHTNLPLPSGTEVTVKKSPYKMRFLRIHPEASFYSTLERKLKGKRNGSSGSKS